MPLIKSGFISDTQDLMTQKSVLINTVTGIAETPDSFWLKPDKYPNEHRFAENYELNHSDPLCDFLHYFQKSREALSH